MSEEIKDEEMKEGTEKVEKQEGETEREEEKTEKIEMTTLRSLKADEGEVEKYVSDEIKEAESKGKNYVERNGRLKRIKVYEFTVVIRPDLGQQKEKEVIEEIKDFVSRKVGLIIEEKNWGEKELAYRIKRYDRGKYFYFEYKSTGEGEQELRKFLETHDDVLRYLIVKKEKIETKGHLWRQKMKEALS
jgi:small subunit ribosomal protein S6